jgi:3-deoxy-manno-octulosonate cytidylyltransferase (CMP-KDO synthetase)
MSGRVAAIIPARLGSTRLPNKPLLRDTGKFLIQHVVERVRRTTRLDPIVVATDDHSILAAVESFGGRAVMTSIEHQSGTDRVAEVASALDVDAVINVQGDEPEIDPRELDRLAAAVLEPGAEIVTLAAPISTSS